MPPVGRGRVPILVAISHHDDAREARESKLLALKVCSGGPLAGPKVHRMSPNFGFETVRVGATLGLDDVMMTSSLVIASEKLHFKRFRGKQGFKRKSLFGWGLLLMMT